MLDIPFTLPVKNLHHSEVIVPLTLDIPDALNFPEPQYHLVEKTLDVQLRYVVHRQFIGFFTPMVFDVRLTYLETSHDSVATLSKISHYFEPFVEGALFMNHTSSFIISMLKGAEAGIQRQDYMTKLRKLVEGTPDLWYSDWLVPPPTIQSQRIVVYDVETAVSMLNPVDVITYLVNTVNKALHPKFTFITQASITDGYVEKIP